MISHPDVFEQVVRQRMDVRRLEAEGERLARLADPRRRDAGFSVREFLGRVRLRLASPRGATAALHRTAHPSRA